MKNTPSLHSPKKRPLFNPGGLFFPKIKNSLVAVIVAPTQDRLVRIYVGAGLTAAALQELFSSKSLH